MSNKQLHGSSIYGLCMCAELRMSGQEIMALAGKATKHLKFIWQLDRHNKIGKGKSLSLLMCCL